jgi:hypothetical protein
LTADDARVLEQAFEETFVAAAIRSQNHKLQNPDLHWIWLFGAPRTRIPDTQRSVSLVRLDEPQSLDRSISLLTFMSFRRIQPLRGPSNLGIEKQHLLPRRTNDLKVPAHEDGAFDAA